VQWIRPIVAADARCRSGKDSADAVTVCGNRSDGERYRIPKNFRDRIERPQQAWSARARDFDEAQRNSDPAVGPFGYVKHHREWVRQWKLEREELAKEQREVARQIGE
jgi:hypothetical protein